MKTLQTPHYVAVFNHKGGTGKTTSAVNLAAALGEPELALRVLVVDLDPSADASWCLGIKDGGKALLEVFMGKRDLASIVQGTTAPGVDIVPSSLWMHRLEEQLAGEYGRELILRQALERLPARWDVVLVDCPPATSLHAVSALAACPELLVPVATQHLPLKGLAGVVRTVEAITKRLNPKLRIGAILPCRYGNNTLSRSVLERIRDKFPAETLATRIRENTKTGEASSHALPITLYDTKSAGAEDYRAAAWELAVRWGLRAPLPGAQPQQPQERGQPMQPQQPRKHQGSKGPKRAKGLR